MPGLRLSVFRVVAQSYTTEAPNIPLSADDTRVHVTGAASTRVSNALGANRPSAARIAALTAVLLTMVVTGSLAVAVLATRRQLGHIFSTDAAVIALGASVLPVIACAFVGDGVNAALGGEQMQRLQMRQ